MIVLIIQLKIWMLKICITKRRLLKIIQDILHFNKSNQVRKILFHLKEILEMLTVEEVFQLQWQQQIAQ